MYSYSFKSVNKIFFKKTIFLYYYSLYIFFLRIKIFLFFFQKIFNISKKYSFFFFLLLFSFLSDRRNSLFYFLYFFSKKIICFSKKIIKNKDNIIFYIKNKNLNIKHINFLRAYFIYKKAVEQYALKKNRYTLFFGSDFFSNFFPFEKHIENVEINIEYILKKKSIFYIKQ